MTLKLDFENATIAGLVLAKVGNPSRNEPLQTSKQLFHVEEDDQATLCSIFLRPFKSFSLIGQKFHHHSSLSNHEVNGCVETIFEDSETLLAKGCELAGRLHSKSNHPNIKSGDLCISRIEGIQVGEDVVQGLCLLKSESVTPFLSISALDGDLQLNTEHGINPEKIDKGCLIIDHFQRKGFYVLTFDRGSSESRFWVRDFLSVIPIPDSALLSKKVAEMAVTAISESTPAREEGDSSPPWKINDAAKEALSYFDDKEHFSMQEFEEKALRTDAARERFAEQRKQLEEDSGMTIDEGFDISKKDVSKARKLMKSVMKFDTGVELRLKPKVVDKPDEILEKGYDEEKKMQFIKVYFNKETS
ncbi:MAG: hypothetical protein ACSHYF_04835 [Verrucomicrobiaceae bacterium]